MTVELKTLPVEELYRRKPSRARRLTWLAILLVIAVLVSGGVVIAQYEPLQLGSSWSIDGPDLEVFEAPGLGSSYSVGFEHGAEFSYEFDLLNSGPWGVTVTDFPFEGHAYFDQLGLKIAPRANPSGGFYDGSQLTSFEPFVLAPHEQRQVKVIFRFTSCPTVTSEDSAYSILSGQQVRFRILGVTRTAQFKLAGPVLVPASGPSC